MFFLSIGIQIRNIWEEGGHGQDLFFTKNLLFSRFSVLEEFLKSIGTF